MSRSEINKTEINATLNFFGLKEKQELLSVFLVFLMIIILFGNGTIIVAIIRFQRLRTPTNQFVAVLALADIMMALSLPYQVVYYLKPSLNTMKHACLMRYITFLLPCGASLTHVLAITVDRFLSVIYPLRYVTMMTNQRVFLISALLWAYSLILGFVPLYWNNWNQTQTCIFTKVLTPGYIITLLIHFFIISLFIMILYMRMFAVTRKHQRGAMTQCSYQFYYVPGIQSQKKTRSLLLYGIIVCFFCFLWIPFFVVVLIQMLWFNNRVIYMVGRIATLLGLISSVINPVIYVLLNKSFRKTIQEMFRPLTDKIRRNNFQDESRKLFHNIHKIQTHPT